MESIPLLDLSSNLSNCENLGFLNINNNNFNEFTLNKLENLSHFWASNNKLNKFSFSECSALQNIDLSKNDLPSLNLKNLVRKPFFAIDISENSDLECIEVASLDWANILEITKDGEMLLGNKLLIMLC